MPYSASEYNMIDYPFNQNKDNALDTAKSFPKTSSGTSLTDFSSQFASHDMNSYFSMPYDDPNWTCPEERSDSLSSPELLSLPIDDSTLSQCNFSDLSGPPTFDSMQSMGSPNCHVDLAKITEGETWTFPPRTAPSNPTRNAEPSHQSAPSPSQTSAYPSPAKEYAPRRRSSVKRADSDSSSGSQSQSQAKRRMHSSGSHEQLRMAKDTDPKPQLEAVDTNSKAKPTAHSIIERRYRDSLNSRITQLDQTLASTRQANKKDGNPVTTEETAEVPGKTRKADVLNEAMRYVKQAELEKEARANEIDFLRLRVAALEKLVMCGDCALLKQFSEQNIGLSTDF